MSFTDADRRYMAQALLLAAKGAGYTSPNPMVGAVVVKCDLIVGQGYHHQVGGAHAEVEALNDAGPRARGATLYVTLEPCHHQGRTPPCTAAIIAAGIKRVVMATRDPNPQVTGGGGEFLKSQGVTVETGLLEKEAHQLNEAFFKAVTTGLPWVIAKAACSLDGKIATYTGDSHWITGPKARALVHRFRHQVDAILVGIATVLTDDPQLTTRLPRRRGRDPIRVILDSNLRIPLTAQVLTIRSLAPTWVACTRAAAPDKIVAVQQTGAEVLVVPGDGPQVNLPALLKLLGQRQVQSLLVEGGAEVHGAFFDQGLVDKFHFFYAPKFIGGRGAFSVLAGQGVASIADAWPAKNLTIRRIGPDLLISGYVG
ncbi:MAG: bifunctional diaminohydroxyphosphoribosylaminopyrimidine deaminase/5-amino-6-(5-phosphoribosylamino)uracil reductase RibD [Desulfobacca sp.]|nr:bifunctional diaminohydroxyphosphoribosylaminopyrimidine deaminase/5-amino-6-(5-phosphoribosylamino)uracil reductase RibD [Desulfobacca sp.]